MARQKTNNTATHKAVTLEWVPFGDLVFLENNPRTRTEEGLSKMAADIERDPSFYENRPTLVNLVNGEYRVYAGDLRAHAAHDVLGWPLIPCNVEADVPPELMRSRAIMDNTHREEFDAKLLSEWGYEPEELEEMGVWLADGETAIEGFGVDEATEGFTLPDGDRAPFQQMTFTLADEQAEQIKNCIAEMKGTDVYKYAETMGNENGNGNALYLIVSEWAGQRTSL